MAPNGGIIDPGTPINGGILGFATPDQVSTLVENGQSAEMASRFEQKEPMDALASHVLKAYDENKRFRSEEIDRIMLEDLRQVNGEYDPDKLSDLKRDGQPVIFFPLTGEKVRGALAWVMDVINYDNGKPFSLDPSPLPDLPEDAEAAIQEQVQVDMQAYLAKGKPVSPGMMFKYAADMRDQIDSDLMEMARNRAKRMETTIYDQMVEGGWHDIFEDFLYNLCWAPCAYIKGPIMRRVASNEYVQGPFGWYSKTVKTIKPTFEAPSPFDVYPSREAITVDDGELCERIKINPSKLQEMKGVDGYQDAAIDKLLASADMGQSAVSNNTDAERYRLEGKGSFVDNRNFVEGVEYWGSVSGKMLKEKGVKEDNNGDPIDDLKFYESNVIIVNNLVIYVAINPESTGKRPYTKTCWHKKPGSFYGMGVPRLMRELQQLVNATVRSLCFNMNQASGFQTIINDINRVPAGESITQSFPGKIWQFTNQNPNNQARPLDFFQPDTRAAELIGVYREFAPKADTITGIPAYSYGNDQVAGAGRTSSGLSMLMSNAARGIKMVLSRIDKDVYRRVIDKLFRFNMEYSQDPDIKGDVVIQCNGALAQIVNQQNSQQIINMLQSTANPIDQAVVGPVERGALWREYVRQLHIPVNSVVKTDDAIRDELNKAQAEQQMAMQQAQAGQGGQPQVQAAV